MAQKRKHKNYKKWLFRMLMLVLFVVAGVMCYLVWDVYFKPEGMTEGDNDGAVEVVEKSVENPETKEEKTEMVEKEKTIQYDGEDPNASDELTGAVTYAGVVGEKLMIRVNIDQYLESGECRLNLVKDGNAEYSDIAMIVANVATATCEGFDVPVSEVGSGYYQIMINLESDGKTGMIESGVNI